MKILSDLEREALLKSLASTTDEILLDAVRQTKELNLRIQQDMKSVQGYVGIKYLESPTRPAASAPPPPPVSSPPSTSEAAPRINKSPGASSITKLGQRPRTKSLPC